MVYPPTKEVRQAVAIKRGFPPTPEEPRDAGPASEFEKSRNAGCNGKFRDAETEVLFPRPDEPWIFEGHLLNKPGQYGPVKIAWEDGCGFLGFEFDGSLYSSLKTLPVALHSYVYAERGKSVANHACTRGHSRKAHGYFDVAGKQRCRVCDREKARTYRSRVQAQGA